MFDIAALRAKINEHRCVIRIAIAEVRGSSPRDPGATMLVWKGGHSGTIGGGQLELYAMQEALDMFDEMDATRVLRKILGPDLGQCCGGAVTLVLERYDVPRLDALINYLITGDFVVRPVEISSSKMPTPITHFVEDEVTKDTLPTMFQSGWFAEPVISQACELIIYGAGHVGNAVARVLSPLECLRITVVDHRQAFLDKLPGNVQPVYMAEPAQFVAMTDPVAQHLIMTPEHDLDLEICHLLLKHGFSFAGLIGSQTKWARFHTRLGDLGHSGAAISAITCPIGLPALGKEPQAVAIGIASELLAQQAVMPIQKRVGA